MGSRPPCRPPSFNIDIHNFDQKNVSYWFRSFEMALSLRGITDPKIRFKYAVCKVPPSFQRYITPEMEASEDYDAFKRTVITKSEPIYDELKSRVLDKYVSLEGRRPSHVADMMLRDAERCDITPSTVRHQWMQLLPSSVRGSCMILRNSPLDEVAALADSLVAMDRSAMANHINQTNYYQPPPSNQYSSRPRGRQNFRGNNGGPRPRNNVERPRPRSATLSTIFCINI